MLKKIIDHRGLYPTEQRIPNQDIRSRLAVFAAQAAANFNLEVKLVLTKKTFNDVNIEVIPARKA